MERIELNVSTREIKGKKTNMLRRSGITPANIYGHGIDSIPLQVDTKQLKLTLAQAGKTDLISLKIDDSKSLKKVLVRDIQKNPLTDEPLHVDFYQVKMTEKLKADIPLAFVGEAPVLKRKNVSLLHLMDTVLVEALPDALPHNLEVDLSSLEDPDQAIYIKDITISDDVTLLSDPESMVVKVTETRREVIEEAEAVPAEGEEEEAEMKAEEAAPESEAEAPAEE
jgi:large subunit ribosomal protein L25